MTRFVGAFDYSSSSVSSGDDFAAEVQCRHIARRTS